MESSFQSEPHALRERQGIPGGSLKKKLSIDVLEHNLVPKMKVIGENDKEKLLKKYGISVKDLPMMRSDDPCAKALGAESGDVVRISRNDPTGSYDYYRLVAK
jgi:DNA-directed RNA polymerase subunit H